MKNLNTIPHLSQFQYDNTPAGLIIVALDENITILEANNGYFDLLGYTREEVRDIFENKGIKTIHEEDIALAFTTIKEILVHNSMNNSVRLRLVNKEDKYRTIHVTSSVEFRDGQIYLHLLMLDLTKHYELFQLIKDNYDFNNIVDSLTDDSYFDFSILENSIRFSPSFCEKFSLPNIVNNYPQSLIKRGLITEDFINLSKKFILIDTDSDLYLNTVTFTFEHEATHYDVTYKVEKDEHGNNIRVIGKMNDVTAKYEQIENLKVISQVDQLTGLYNKITTERLITSTIKNRRSKDGIYALFIIDADNFKSVNDNFGHLYGDIVLTQLADHLKTLFRSNDIIGRIGGDEFIVLLRDYSSLELIIKKAKGICSLFNKVYTEDSVSVEMSASVGISLFPDHGKSFNELYNNADIALYHVKSSGKNNYKIYDSKLKIQHVPQRTELDESTIKKDFKENQVEYIFKLLYSYNDSISAVKATLPLIMDQYNFKRAFFFESYNKNEIINSYAISTNNTHQPLNKYLFNTSDYTLQIEEAIEKGYYFRDKNSSLTKEQRHPLFAQSTSVFLYPILFEKNALGVIGFDTDSEDHLLSEKKLDDLKSISTIISTFLSKNLALKKSRANEAMILSILEELDKMPLEKIKSRIKDFLECVDCFL